MAVKVDLARDYICYLNGEYIPLSEAKVSVLDAGLHGDAVFDEARDRPGHDDPEYRDAEHAEGLGGKPPADPPTRDQEA